MTKNHIFDNCVYFDDQLSAIYDETRPFRGDESPILAELCTRLIDMNRGKKYIRLLDVGSGTGRIIIPLAESYEKLAGKRDGPHLQIHCVEKSPHMLNKLQYKYSLCNFHFIEIDAKEPRDIRDISASIEPFDAVISHWVFHVISDWRVALLAVDQVMKPTAQIFLLRESSPFYKAIDGDYRYILNDNVKKFWQVYHTKRAEYMRKNQINLPILSARSRLGSLVLDARVDHLYAALGWKTHQKFSANGADCWSTTKPLSFFIETVIRQRAFTNMRLIPDDEFSIKLHEDIANELRQSVALTDQSYKWTYQTSLEGSVLIRDPAHRITREMVLHLLRDTLGRRWRRKMEYGYNQQSLWARLFERIWERLNADKEPCGFLGSEISKNTPIIFANAPFFQIHQTVYTTTDSNCTRLFVNSWHDLTFAGETNTPFCIGFESRIPHKTTLVQKISYEQIADGIQPHAFVHYLWISSDEEIQLLQIPVGLSEDKSMQHVIDIEAKLHSLIDRAIIQGLIPYDIEDLHRRFLLGLAKISRTSEVACAYYFTFRDDSREAECDPLGICIGYKSMLPPFCCDFIHSISETIFNEFLEDRVAEKEHSLSRLSSANSQEPNANPLFANHIIKKHVFLSYCKDDEDDVKRLYKDLSAAGEVIWWMRDIQPGLDWKHEIRKAMRAAYAFVIIFSKKTQDRTTSGIYPELSDALNVFRETSLDKIFLIPVRISECQIPLVEIDGSRTLDRIQRVDLFPEEQRTAGLQSLLNSIRAVPHHP